MKELEDKLATANQELESLAQSRSLKDEQLATTRVRSNIVSNQVVAVACCNKLV